MIHTRPSARRLFRRKAPPTFFSWVRPSLPWLFRCLISKNPDQNPIAKLLHPSSRSYFSPTANMANIPPLHVVVWVWSCRGASRVEPPI